MLPAKRQRPRMGLRDDGPLVCPAHRAFVRSHGCSVPGCQGGPIEAHHVRVGTNAGTGRKSDDSWLTSLCTVHHAEAHSLGCETFDRRHGINLRLLALEFAARSPAWQKFIKRRREP